MLTAKFSSIGAESPNPGPHACTENALPAESLTSPIFKNLMCVCVRVRVCARVCVCVRVCIHVHECT